MDLVRAHRVHLRPGPRTCRRRPLDPPPRRRPGVSHVVRLDGRLVQAGHRCLPGIVGRLAILQRARENPEPLPIDVGAVLEQMHQDPRAGVVTPGGLAVGFARMEPIPTAAPSLPASRTPTWVETSIPRSCSRATRTGRRLEASCPSTPSPARAPQRPGSSADPRQKRSRRRPRRCRTERAPRSRDRAERRPPRGDAAPPPWAERPLLRART